MASKKSRPLDDPPAASSSEEVESEEEEDEEESEEEQEIPEKSQSKPQPKQPQSEEEEEEDDEQCEESDEEETEDEDQEDQPKKTKNKPIQPPLPTSTNSKKNPHSDSSSDSDSQKSPRASDFTIKPISPSLAEEKPETPVSKPSAKRQAENGKVSSKPKRTKSSAEQVAEEGVANASTPAGKKLVNRLWSEEDEIAILKGVIEFQTKKGKDAFTYPAEYYEFVKKSFHVDVSKNQLVDKARRMKKKFKPLVDKSINGEEPVFSKSHERKSFELFKKILGNNNGVDGNANSTAVHEKPSTGKSSRKTNTDKVNSLVSNADANADANANAMAIKEENLVKSKSEKVEVNQGKKEEDFEKDYPFIMSAFRADSIPVPDLVKSNWCKMSSSQLNEWNSKWKKQNAAEIEVFIGRINLVEEQTRMVLDAIDSSKN